MSALLALEEGAPPPLGRALALAGLGVALAVAGIFLVRRLRPGR